MVCSAAYFCNTFHGLYGGLGIFIMCSMVCGGVGIFVMGIVVSMVEKSSLHQSVVGIGEWTSSSSKHVFIPRYGRSESYRKMLCVRRHNELSDHDF
ncbi:hypothetical protein HBI23_183090 [Parastagonospora nodorum]|nr:hypothetical protein HBI12_171950 [Parastagonospora nodorum]KAH5434816.1 hypothetical protein HBI47_078720 [Parastagonospora nodorum]KAH5647246.1 hypothetical protein HBI23_183090 [Parastagonospora nodorum]